MRVRRGHVPPPQLCQAGAQYTRVGTFPARAQQGVYSPHPWIYCSRKLWAENRAGQRTSDPRCSRYLRCPRSDAQCCLWHPRARASPCLAPQHCSHDRHRCLPGTAHPLAAYICLHPKSVHPPATIRRGVKDVPAAQPHGLCAARQGATLSEMC